MPVFRPPQSATPPPPRRYLPFLASVALEFLVFVTAAALVFGAVELASCPARKEAIHARR